MPRPFNFAQGGDKINLMLKRIAIVAFFTGSGQLLSIFVLKWISQHYSVQQLRGIGEIDSLFFFIMNLVGLGLQSAAMRDIAQSGNWKQDYHDTQSARITLGILLMAATALAVVNEYYVVFMLAPMLALSGDYALYARGYAIQGSIVAFARLVIPFSAVLAAAFFFNVNPGWVYAISLFITYAVTNAAIAYFLKTNYLYRFSFKKLRLYITSLPLGVATVCLYFLGLGLVLIIPYFYPTDIVATAFIGLRFYVLYKGVLRIINQAFLWEMQSEEVCLKVDQLCIIAGALMFGSLMIFPDSFITLFFGAKYLPHWMFFKILGVDALIYSFFISHNTRALYLKADKQLATVCLVAVLGTVVSLTLLAVFSNDITNIAIALGIGEFIYAAGLVMLAGSKKQIANRMIFASGVLPLLLIPLAARYWLGDRLGYYMSSFILLCIVIFILHHRKFKTLSPVAQA